MSKESNSHSLAMQSLSAPSFHRRRPIDLNGSSQGISSLMVCAERPSINYVRRVFKDMGNSAPLPIAEDINALFEARKVWNPQEFEVKIGQLLSQLQKTVSERSWAPEEKYVDRLGSLHLFSGDGVDPSNSWIENLEMQVKAMRFCHLRNIAKKGTDLDDARHYAAHLTDPSDKSYVERVKAAYEILTREDISLQAKELIESAIENGNWDGSAIEISCLRPVKDYDDHSNSYNFLTATYAHLLRENLEKVATELFPDMEIKVVDHPVMMLTHTNRTNSSPFGRILKQPLFKAEGLEGRNVLIIDDHVNAGAFSSTLASQAQESGAKVIGVAAYSRHPNSKTLTADPKIKTILTDMYPAARVDSLLSSVGLSIDSLTNREALTLLAIFADPKNERNREDFRLIGQELGESEFIPGVRDDLRIEFDKPAIGLDRLQEDIQEMLESGRVR